MRLLQYSSIILIFLIYPAHAEEKELYKEIKYFEQTSDAKLSVCGAEYTIVFKDEINDLGIDGIHMTIASFGAPGKFWTIIKLGLGTFGKNQLKNLTPLPVGTVSFKAEDRIFSAKRTVCQTVDNQFCGGFAGDEAGFAATYVQFPDAELIFNQKPGTLDYHLNISSDLLPGSDMSKFQEHLEADKKHTQCLTDLLVANAPPK